METSYFIKMFYLKKYEFWIQRMNQKINREAKRPGKLLTAIRKNHIDKNKEKKGILCELVHFIQCKAQFRPFMQLSKYPFENDKNNIFMFLCIFALSQLYFSFFQKNQALDFMPQNLICIAVLLLLAHCFKIQLFIFTCTVYQDHILIKSP